MRIRLGIATAAKELPWPCVLTPGRGVIYDLLGRAAPDLATRLHSDGFGAYGLAPFGHSAPVFPRARRRRGSYAAGGSGIVEFSSPLPDVVEAMAVGLRECEVLDWGGVAFHIDSVQVVDPPTFGSGCTRMRTSTPVVLKVAGGTAQSRGTAWVLPGDPEFADCLEHNLRRKAETLGLATDVELTGVTWVGAQRSFAVGGGKKTGAPVEVELIGDPLTLQAIWSWGLGQANSAGFGWIGSAW